MMHDFPYTDLHELNLDWFLENFKKLESRVKAIESGGISITVDNALSITSTNPVQNRVITQALDDLSVYVTPEQFGAVGNGIADDTTSFQNALNSGKPIMCLSKAYKITDTLRIKGDTLINLNGSEIVSTRKHLFYNFLDDDVFMGYSGNGNIMIYNGTIIYGSVAFWHCENILFDNVNFKNCGNNHFIEICACKNFVIRNCSFIGMSYNGDNAFHEYINIDPCTTTVSTYFTGGSFPAGNYDGTKNNGIKILNCYFNINENDANYQTMDDAIGCHTPLHQQHENIMIDGCFIYNFTQRGVRLSDMKNVVFQNNDLESHVNANHAVYSATDDDTLYASLENAIIQNNILRVHSHGFVATNAKNVIYKDNIYYSDTAHTIVSLYGDLTEHVSIIGNKTQRGFNDAYTLSRSTITDGVFDALQETMIPNVTYADNVFTCENLNFTEFSEITIAFGLTGSGTFYEKTVSAFWTARTLQANVTYPIVTDPNTGNPLLSVTIPSTAKNTMVLSVASGVTFKSPRHLIGKR